MTMWRVLDFVKNQNQAAGHSRYRHLAETAVTMMAFAYLGRAAKDFLEGRQLEDPYSPETWLKAGMRGGLGGILADFTVGELLQPGAIARDATFGPAVDMATDIIGAFQDIASPALNLVRDKDFKSGKGMDFESALGKLSHHIPYQNIHIRKILFDYTIQEVWNDLTNASYKQQKKLYDRIDARSDFFGKVGTF
jgi:hypothetical protein